MRLNHAKRKEVGFILNRRKLSRSPRSALGSYLVVLLEDKGTMFHRL